MSTAQVLDSARKYFDWVLEPQYDEFFANEADFRRLIALASSLFHYHEWLFVEFPDELQQEFGRPDPFKNEACFWSAVESKNPKFGFVRDIANASKHVSLNRKPSTSMTDISKTVIQVAMWDEAQWDEANWDTPYVVSKDGSNDVLFDTFARELFDYWKYLINKISPPDDGQNS